MGGRKPKRLSEIISIVASADPSITVERPSSGSHWKFKKPGKRTYPIPAANGLREEIPFHYIRALCRNMGPPLCEDHFTKD